jgi:hypothetical protein
MGVETNDGSSNAGSTDSETAVVDLAPLPARVLGRRTLENYRPAAGVCELGVEGWTRQLGAPTESVEIFLLRLR